MKLENQKIAVIGLGYVGLPLAVEFGKHHHVLGFDINTARVAELQSGRDSTLEVAPEELVQAKHLHYSTHLDDLRDCSVFIVTVPTPVDQANRPDMTPLVKASETVGKVLPSGAVVIYESTVYPGATEEVCVPVLEKFSGLKFNRDFYCGYSPERINPGDKVNTLTKIKKITSGSTPEVADAVDELYRGIITAGTHKASSIKVAEAAKVIENTQRDLNIALINELSVIFARLGIDTLDVLEAAGSKWNFLPFRPGLVGGHCIGVDPYYLTHKAEEVGYHPQVILAGRRINDNMARYVARNTIKLMLQNGLDVPRCRVGVLGVTFKENCPDTGVLSVRWRSGALGSLNCTMLTYPKNLEGSITILGEKGTVRVGGVAVNEIQEWQFADSQPDDEKIKSASYETTSVYGFGHPLYYDNVIKTLRGEAEAEVDGREGLKSLEVLIATYRSARDGVRVGLPLEL